MMPGLTNDPAVVEVSRHGRVTIPKPLRESLGIETPGEVFVYAEGDRLVFESVPTPDDLHGIHAGDHPPGAILDQVHELTADERRLESE